MDNTDIAEMVDLELVVEDYVSYLTIAVSILLIC